LEFDIGKLNDEYHSDYIYRSDCIFDLHNVNIPLGSTITNCSLEVKMSVASNKQFGVPAEFQNPIIQSLIISYATPLLARRFRRSSYQDETRRLTATSVIWYISIYFISAYFKSVIFFVSVKADVLPSSGWTKSRQRYVPLGTFGDHRAV
jgi:hypothetical protein